MTIAERDTRKRLLINRHIAKMTPGEIARRFSVYAENGFWQRQEPRKKQRGKGPLRAGRVKGEPHAISTWGCKVALKS